MLTLPDRRKFVLAPEERDVYSDDYTRKALAPLGAKPGNGTLAGAGKRLPPLGRTEKQCSVAPPI